MFVDDIEYSKERHAEARAEERRWRQRRTRAQSLLAADGCEDGETLVHEAAEVDEAAAPCMEDDVPTPSEAREQRAEKRRRLREEALAKEGPK